MIADKIRRARNAKGFSQEYVAEALGMSQSAYSKIELKKTKIDFNFLQEIAQVLELSTSELISYGDSDLLLSRIALLENQLFEIQKIVREQQTIIQTIINR